MKREWTLYLILFGYFLKEFSRSLLYPNLIVISYGFFGDGVFDAVRMGFLLTAQMGGAAAACLIFGTLADKIKRKSACLITILFWIFGLFFSALFHSYYILLLGQLFLGIGAGGYVPVTQAIISDIASADKKGEIYGLTSIFWVIGLVAGMITAALLSPAWHFPFFFSRTDR